MKKIIFALAMLALTFTATYAQTGVGKSRRVQFKKGARTVTMTGTISRTYDGYVLSARRGQSVVIKVTGKGAPNFSIGTVPAGTSLSSISGKYKPKIWTPNLNSETYVVDSADDVAILVGSKPGTSYRLTISIK